MKILVTGSNGYIGSRAVERLLKKNYEVHAVVHNDNSYRLEDHQNLTIFNHDELDDASTGVDYALHFGALYNTKNDSKVISELIQSNIEFSAQLFRAMDENAKSHARIIAASTFSSFDENGVYDPANFYSATKSAVEQLAYAFETPTVFLRLCDTYGENDYRTKVHNLLVSQLIYGSVFSFQGDSEQLVRLLHVDDVVDAFVFAAEDLELTSNTVSYNLFYSNNEMTLSDIYIQVSEELKNRGFIGGMAQFPLFSNVNILPPADENNLPGFKPKHNPNYDLAETLLFGRGAK